MNMINVVMNVLINHDTKRIVVPSFLVFYFKGRVMQII